MWALKNSTAFVQTSKQALGFQGWLKQLSLAIQMVNGKALILDIELEILNIGIFASFQYGIGYH